MKPSVLRQLEEEARLLLGFSLTVGRIQHAAGRSYVHEHPSRATSWKEPDVLAMIEKTNGGAEPSLFKTTTFDMCRFGLRSPRGWPLQKSTRFMFCNLPGLASRFNVKCQCTSSFTVGQKRVRHRMILGSEDGVKLSRHAQIYPPAMVDALVSVISDHVRA